MVIKPISGLRLRALLRMSERISATVLVSPEYLTLDDIDRALEFNRVLGIALESVIAEVQTCEE